MKASQFQNQIDYLSSEVIFAWGTIKGILILFRIFFETLLCPRPVHELGNTGKFVFVQRLILFLLWQHLLFSRLKKCHLGLLFFIAL